MSARSSSTSSSLTKKLTYEMLRRFEHGAYQHFFKARCAKCNKSEEVAWSAGSEPARIAKKMQDMGWSYDAFKSRACVCPECKGKRTVGRPRPLHVVAEIKARLATPEYDIHAAEMKRRRVIKPETKKEEPTVAQVLTMSAAAPRPLTNAEKSGIRRMLDEHFDDAQGRYIDGYSDQRVGTELDVPWAAVANIREAAYGPLRVDPRLDKLRADLLDLQTQANKLAARINGDIEALTKRIATAEKTLNDINTGS